jgi:16S rRNA (uracil1498-N3)-methyltransferase
MTSPRFLVRTVLAAGTTIELPAAASHHARRVLRLRAGDALTLFDGVGNEYAARFAPDPVNASRSEATIAGGGPVDREPRLRITLVQALSAQEKLDWLVEKAVELGAHRIVLAPAARSVVRLDGARRERRLERLREIAAAACCQCGRNRIPEIAIADGLEAALRAGADARSRWVLDPASPTALLRGFASGAPEPGVEAASLAVGPEGGYTDAELALARALGYSGARLGARVLRTETAGLAAISALLAASGEYS